MTKNCKEYFLLFLLITAVCALPVISLFAPKIYGTGFVALALISYMLWAHINKAFPKPDITLTSFLVSIIALAEISYFWATEPEGIAERSSKIALIFIAGALFITLMQNLTFTFRKRLHRPLVDFYILGCAVLLFEGLTQNTLMHTFNNTGYDIVIDSQTNAGAVILSLCLWPVLHILLSEHKKLFAWLLYLIVFTAIIIASESQTALLALVIGSGCWVTCRLSRKAAQWICYIGVPAALLSMPVIAKTLFQNFADDLHRWEGANAARRLEIWDSLVNMIYAAPYTGYGLQAARHIEHLDMQNLYYQRESVLHPHNGAIQIWLEFGLLGAILASIFSLYILYRISKITSTTNYRMAMATFTAAFSALLVGYGLWQSWWLGALFAMAGTVALARYPAQAQNKTPA